jgi:hypothetical protein
MIKFVETIIMENCMQYYNNDDPVAELHDG